ncbi:disease resistance protein RPP13-like isoform X2 [Olea europaea var. sylvestris]|uniref:disease resistance protein RPP13-like isoform X2 n=1 Tax=Olea europaea var. sylvestris TaxID=158386 RepID=UPI000C1CDE99|nr:disease resistance protein RPP13-like isoform X2 [Olea europaea var. sylvestris]
MDDSLINGYENDGSLQEFRTYFVPDIKKRIQDVQRKLDFWHRLLKDLDKKKSKGSSEHYLEREIRDFVSRLQNVLETYFNEVQRRRGRSIVGKFIDDFKSVRMADLDVKEINMQIRLTTWHFKTLKSLSPTAEEEISQSANENPETEIRRKLRRCIFDSGENDIVVKDQSLQTLKSALLDGNDRVICIYGWGGTGKTALAHKLYTDPEVQSLYQIRSAVEIGPEFAVKNVLKSVLEQLPEGRERKEQPNLKLETVAEHFKEYGKDVRYLFVLDDIRSLDDWSLLRRIFPKNQNGSKLMLTTRLADVAFSVDEDEPDGLDEPGAFVHMMRRLSPSDSFQLFHKTAVSCDHDDYKKGKLDKRYTKES